MGEKTNSKRTWPERLIAIWLIFNGLPGLVCQVLRLAGIETYATIPGLDAGFHAMDHGVVVMDVILANPLYLLGGVLLWRGHRWGPGLSVAGLVLLTYLMGMFAVAFTQLDAWGRVPVADVVFVGVTFPVNALSVVHLACRHRGRNSNDRNETEG